MEDGAEGGGIFRGGGGRRTSRWGDGDVELEFDEFAGVIEDGEVVAEGLAAFAFEFGTCGR